MLSSVSVAGVSLLRTIPVVTPLAALAGVFAAPEPPGWKSPETSTRPLAFPLPARVVPERLVMPLPMSPLSVSWPL